MRYVSCLLYTSQTAKAAAKATQKAAQAAKATAKAAATGIKAAARATLAAAKASIAAAKGLAAVIAAGGWGAVAIILIVCIMAMVARFLFGNFSGGEDPPTFRPYRMSF